MGFNSAFKGLMLLSKTFIKFVRFFAVALLWHSWLGNGLSQWGPKFDPRPVHVNFVVDKVAL
jgi:hypothetical protein